MNPSLSSVVSMDVFCDDAREIGACGGVLVLALDSSRFLSGCKMET